MLYNHHPDFTHLHTFGCLCFASTNYKHPNKFDPRAKCCAFLGYPQGQKAYRLYDVDAQQFFVSCDVIFHGTIFPFRDDQNLRGTPNPSPILPSPIPDLDFIKLFTLNSPLGPPTQTQEPSNHDVVPLTQPPTPSTILTRP